MNGCMYRGGGLCITPVTTAAGQIQRGDSGTLCPEHYEQMCRERRWLQGLLLGVILATLGTVAMVVLAILGVQW